MPKTLDEIVAHRVEFLTGYQDAAYAERYRALVRRVQDAEANRTPGQMGLAEAVARSYAKLLAYKDEYEVARLYTDGAFRKKIEGMFEGDYRVVGPARRSAAPRASRPRYRRRTS